MMMSRTAGSVLRRFAPVLAVIAVALAVRLLALDAVNHPSLYFAKYPTLAAQSELMTDFANVWQTADKIVYSTTLHAVSTANTRLERNFDPDSVRDMKTTAASDLTVGGPTLGALRNSATGRPGDSPPCRLPARLVTE